MKTGKLAFMGLFTLLTLSNFTQADDTDHSAGPCRVDVEKLCKGIEPGEGRIMKCIHENKDKLSAECKAKIDAKKVEMKSDHDACKADLEKLCGTVEKGQGRKMKCLKENEGQLSDGCKAAMSDNKMWNRKGKKDRK